jgi:tetratricopeptide (TPR) repeat protein
MARLRTLRILLLAAVSATSQPKFNVYAQAGTPAGGSPTAEAERLIGQGHLDEALKSLDSLALQTPEPTGVERLRGIAYYEQGKVLPSVEAFEKAVAQDPADREAMQMEGVGLFRIGKPAAAIPLLEKAHLSIASANIDSDYVLGLCYLDTQRYDDARKAFATQYGFPSDSPSAYLLAARMMLRREYLAPADTFAQKALTLNASLPMAHFLVGQIRLAESKFPEAIAEFEKERELNPLFGELYDRLGDTYVRQGDYAKAQEALNRAVLLEPTSPVPFILLGKVLLKQQQPVMAKMYLEKALAMEPGNYITHSLLGQAYRLLGRTDQASHEFQIAEQIQAAAQPQLESLR